MACVGNDDDLRCIPLGGGGGFVGTAEGMLFVDHTTASFKITIEHYAISKGQGTAFGDAPVFAKQAGAVNGQLSIMSGADLADMTAPKPS